MKKADATEHPECQGFDRVGLLVNRQAPHDGLPFNESSELDFMDQTEPLPN